MSRLLLLATACALGGSLALTAGCDEVSARRLIQKGDSAYEDGDYEEAVAKYERALDKAPHLDTGHHNLALAYIALFQPGSEDEENLVLADRATEHLQSYLEENPESAQIRRLLTDTWIQAGRFDDVRAYWEERRERYPENRDILMMLARIESLSGDYRAAVERHRERFEMEEREADKVQALVDIAQLQLSRLRGDELVGADRAEAADFAIGALQEAKEIDPEHETVLNYLGSVYQLRAFAHGASWANQIDQATFRVHHREWEEVSGEDEVDEEEAEGDGEDDAAAEAAGDSDS